MRLPPTSAYSIPFSWLMGASGFMLIFGTTLLFQDYWWLRVVGAGIVFLVPPAIVQAMVNLLLTLGVVKLRQR